MSVYTCTNNDTEVPFALQYDSDDPPTDNLAKDEFVLAPIGTLFSFHFTEVSK